MKIYLARPDVFRSDAGAWAVEARNCLLAHGHEALLPLDNEASTAAGIFSANIALIQAADAVLANLNPFRGCEPDSGTCFEIGYAHALGKPVFAYLEDARPLAERLAASCGPLAERDGRLFDAEGWAVENFELPVNLMLGLACRFLPGGLAEAIEGLSAVCRAVSR